MDREKHWENIYNTREFKEASWYEEKPTTSLKFIEELKIPKEAKIIDVGGGDSYFVDHLLEMGYTNTTVLDISEAALNKVKIRLGKRAEEVVWIKTDALQFNPKDKYDFWHDRAAFHFLTSESEIESYLSKVHNSLKGNGIFVLGTFSENGPTKCSGIEVKRYSQASMTTRLNKYFKKVSCKLTEHLTPFGTTQNFIFCSFRKK